MKIGENRKVREMGLFRFFAAELRRGYLLEREEEKFTQKRERVYTFMKTPRELEKFCFFGFFLCVDAFLFLFTFLPLRILLAFVRMFTQPCGIWSSRSRTLLEPAQICDILKGIIAVICFFIINEIDTSVMYHLVRGQAVIKLYVFFNMMEVADRLLSSFGQDVLDALFWTATEPQDRKRERLGVIPHLLIAITYVICHALLILFQATVLNVAFNSHNKALLTIMMSNNFVEIKSNLFRKVDTKNLYQISCSDVKERFHYIILLFVVFIRNMSEVNWDPEHIWTLLPDASLVLIAELLVDWGKHAFITKFNEIPADTYRLYKLNLAKDMAVSRQGQAFTDHSDLVSRRMGLTPLPLACLLVRICVKSIKMGCSTGLFVLFMILFYLCLMSLKILISIILLGHSYDIIQTCKEQNTGLDDEWPMVASETRRLSDSFLDTQAYRKMMGNSEMGNEPQSNLWKALSDTALETLHESKKDVREGWLEKGEVDTVTSSTTFGLDKNSKDSQELNHRNDKKLEEKHKIEGQGDETVLSADFQSDDKVFEEDSQVRQRHKFNAASNTIGSINENESLVSQIDSVSNVVDSNIYQNEHLSLSHEEPKLSLSSDAGDQHSKSE
ncbi:hypothetical protein CHS0354_003601 [Potamilus streckersoni]|uniref:Protein TAPT1 homolog n=1 Tax=Potamilus streckersoni TaxID=2493646 RepID=A0AAE0S902_9BIVA|nr:hypothetical protein CHS0354_003601 [Potamilus streckersoni]